MKKLNFLILVFFVLGIELGNAQYTVLHNFSGPDGKLPIGSLTLLGNKLYGMATQGGANEAGCIFSIDTNGIDYKDLFDFNSTTGGGPAGALTYYGGILYGMTSSGADGNSGSIFTIDTEGRGFRVIYNFGLGPSAGPDGSLVFSGNKMYGMTNIGGGFGEGTIFSIDTNGGGYKELYSMGFPAEPATPFGSIKISGAKLFGMSAFGGLNNGDIFSIDTDGTAIENLVNLGSSTGYGPWGDVTISGTRLFGMTTTGGTNNDGTIFAMDSDGNGFTVLLDFAGTISPQGRAGTGDLLLNGNKFYGMTLGGGADSCGVIFSVDTNGGSYTDLYNFDSAKGWGPQGSLTLSGNVLYGMARNGGTSDSGVIFSFRDNSITTSIKQLPVNLSEVSVYPNPNKGVFTIAFSYPAVIVRPQTMVEIFNVLGEQVYSEQSKINSQLSIELSNQPSGVYFYRAISETGALIGEGKMVIQK